ncbi:MAG: HAMP domain-containing histidine kinase [Sphingobacteriales bacterium]|nr:MAG: HAMP domain-containing histidine kinase [Sphingobacteriales bacterium]
MIGSIVTDRKVKLAIITFGILIGILACLIQFAFPYLSAKPNKQLLDLTGPWSVCYRSFNSRNCSEWESLDVHLKFKSEKFRAAASIVLRKQFIPPSVCFMTERPCTLVLRDMGGNGLVFLNDKVIGRKGISLTDNSYQRYFLFSAFLPPDIFKSTLNEIKIEIFSKPADTLRQQSVPIGIFEQHDADDYVSSARSYLVVFPLVIALIILTVVCIYAALRAGLMSPPTNDFTYVIFCLVWAANLISFSGVLDQILGRIAPEIHFPLSYLSSLLTIMLTYKYTNPLKTVPRSILVAFTIPISLFLILAAYSLIVPEKYPEVIWAVYVVESIALWLTVIAPFICWIQFIRSGTGHAKTLMTIAFGFLTFATLRDGLIFNRVLDGVYLARVYPLGIVSAFSWLYFEMLMEAYSRNSRDHRSVLDLKKVAHDIRAPVAVISHSLLKCYLRDDDESDLVKSAVIRLQDIAKTILNQSSDNTNRSPVLIGQKLGEIVEFAQYSAGMQNLGVRILLDIKPKASGPVCDVVESEFSRCISNLILNAVEASPKGSIVSVTLEESKQNAVISIQDQGSGMPDEMLRRVGQYGFSTKKHGNGIGVYSAIQYVYRIKGKITFSNSKTVGLLVRIDIPIIV